MLKHCSPSSVDVRRGRRDCDLVSLDSSSSSLTHASLATNTRDASTSPLAPSRIQPWSGLRSSATNTPRATLPLKIYASCLRSEIEYKTVGVNPRTTANEVICMLLNKCRMRHRDPRLFFLTMELIIGDVAGTSRSSRSSSSESASTSTSTSTSSLVRRSLALDGDSRPWELRECCRPWGECKFSLEMRKGGLVRVYDSVIMKESQYKSLLISETTTVQEMLSLLSTCYALNETQRRRLCLLEQCHYDDESFERRLSGDELPVEVQRQWRQPTRCRFQLRLRPSMIMAESGITMDKRDDQSQGREPIQPLLLQEHRHEDDHDLEKRCSRSSSAGRSARHSHEDAGAARQGEADEARGGRAGGSRGVRSLHSLLDALPAASVDTGLMDNGAKRTSLSSISLDSNRSSEYDAYFYI